MSTFLRRRFPRVVRLTGTAVIGSTLAVGFFSPQPASADPALGDRDVPTRAAAYAERASALRNAALAQGRIDYQTVIDAAYGPGAITLEILAAKERWRQELPPRFAIMADYGASDRPVAVTTFAPVRNLSLQSTLVARYEAIEHEIAIAAPASDFAIFHEVGHALQRAALRLGKTRSSASHATDVLLDDALAAAPLDETSRLRLRYLSSQDEFEVRLQDLNRFCAWFVTGDPILRPTDSLRALTALGVVVRYEDARTAFARAGATLTPDEFAACAAEPVVASSWTARAFEDAHDLCLLQSLAERAGAEIWSSLLAKIIFEAPGHL